MMLGGIYKNYDVFKGELLMKIDEVPNNVHLKFYK